MDNETATAVGGATDELRTVHALMAAFLIWQLATLKPEPPRDHAAAVQPTPPLDDAAMPAPAVDTDLAESFRRAAEDQGRCALSHIQFLIARPTDELLFTALRDSPSAPSARSQRGLRHETGYFRVADRVVSSRSLHFR